MMRDERQSPPPQSANITTRSQASDDAPGIVKLPQVIESELAEIVQRRQEAGLPLDRQDADSAKAQVRDQLVGLSLSGGGIRSASFSLGFLQTLYQTGLLRHIDYISSVSGGGYAAASLASEVMHPETHLAWEGGAVAPPGRRGREGLSGSRHNAERRKKAARPGRHGGKGSPGTNCQGDGAARPPGPAESAHFGLAPDGVGRQPQRVVDLVHGGAYLRRPRMFVNRWLIGVVLIGIVTVAGIIAATSLAAFLFRALDDEAAARVIDALGFKGDIGRAFFPCALASAAWLIAWAISYWRRGERATGEMAQWLLLLAVALALMALAALLGTGNIDLTYLRDLFGISSENRSLGWLADYMKVALPGLLGFFLLPYLSPRELIRSGVRPRNALEGWIFAIASRALLFGVPLMLFGVLAQENISHHNEQRYLKRYGARIPTVYTLVRSDFRDWDDAWNRLELEKNPSEPLNPLSRRLWMAANLRDEPDRQDPGKVKTLRAGLKIELREKLRPPTALNDQLRRRWDETRGSTGKPDETRGARGKPEEWPPQSPIELWRLVWAWKVELDRELNVPQRWLLALGAAVTGEQNDFVKIVRLDEYSTKIQNYICDYLTKVVVEDPDLYDDLNKALPAPTRPRSSEERLEWEEAVDQLKREGAQLAYSTARDRKDIMVRVEERGEQIRSSEPVDFREWNAGRWERRLNLDRKPPGWAFWSKKPEDIQRQEHDLRDYVFAENGRALRLKTQIDRLNWRILRTVYPDLFYDKSTVFAKVVQPEDQWTRLGWFAWSLGVFVVFGAVVNMNACSLHGFYKERLASMWIEPCPGMGQEIPLALLETTNKGAPYHLFGATLNAMKLGAATAKAPEDVFVFSHAYCGSERTGFLPTGQFARGRYDLASAVSLSGAALSPAYFRNPLLWSLMLLTNLRLGQWLPNPAHPRPARWRAPREAWGPVPIRLLTSLVRSTVWSAGRGANLAEKVSKPFFCYVTDGGYIENLGLEQLLLRRCRLVIVCDASCDPAPDFGALMDVVRRARTEHGIHIHRLRPGPGSDGYDLLAEEPAGHEDLGLQDLCPLVKDNCIPTTATANGRLFSREHVVLARILYPPGEAVKGEGVEAGPTRPGATPKSAASPIDEGLLVYVKPTLTGDEDADLIRFWGENLEFPHDSTMDQFYTPAKFESYRQLGAHSGRQVIKRLAGLGEKLVDECLGGPGWDLVEYWAAEFSNGNAPGHRTENGSPAHHAVHAEPQSAAAPPVPQERESFRS